MNTLRYTCFMTVDSPSYTFAAFATWRMVWPAFTFFGKRPVHYAISTHVLNVYRGLTIPNSHLSHNVFQCNPRCRHMCKNWQRQNKLLHSYTGCCCIRWYLQEQYQTCEDTKSQLHKHKRGSVAPNITESHPRLYVFRKRSCFWGRG